MAWATVMDALAERVRASGAAVGAVVGVEARGFLVGVALAERLGVGFVPVRKQGKLPAATIAAEYELEYGTATVEVHIDALGPGTPVVVVDDVLATGGTLEAAVRLVREIGADPILTAVLVEIAPLGGRARLDPLPCVALLILGAPESEELA